MRDLGMQVTIPPPPEAAQIFLNFYFYITIKIK